MIHSVKVTCGGNHYKLCSSEGHLRHTFDRNELGPRKAQTAVMQGIDPTKEGFKRNISVQEACSSYGSMEHCNCKGDCSNLSRCACRVAGRLCTSLCHGGRGNNKNCTLIDNLEESGTEYDIFTYKKF